MAEGGQGEIKDPHGIEGLMVLRMIMGVIIGGQQPQMHDGGPLNDDSEVKDDGRSESDNGNNEEHMETHQQV